MICDAIKVALGGQWSTKCFSIENNKVRSNHLAHGVLALGWLGASPERIYQFVGHRITTLEPAAPHMIEELSLPPLMSFDEASLLIGRGQSFYRLFSFYESEIQKRGIDETIHAYLPKLWNGLCGAAFHGAIHLGYGYAGGPIDRLVVEGLAYLHRSNVQLLVPPRTDSQKNADATFESYTNAFVSGLADIRSHEELVYAVNNCENSGNVMNRMKVLSSGDFGAVVASHVSKLPPCKEIGWLLDAAIKLFSSTCRDKTVDFFLLHGVTVTWAMSQLSPLFTDPSGLLRSLETGMFVTYVAQGSPELKEEVRFIDSLDAEETTWEAIIKKTIEFDGNEHMYKLVQVCKDRTESKDRNLSIDDYKEAALRCINYNFRY